MSDTPRTDAAIRGREIEGFGRIEIIDVEFARKLERETAELRSENDRMRKALDAERERFGHI